MAQKKKKTSYEEVELSAVSPRDAELRAAKQDMYQFSNRHNRYWAFPKARSRDYAEELRTGRHKYTSTRGKFRQGDALTESDKAFRRGYMQGQVDQSGVYYYKKARNDNLSHGEGKYLAARKQYSRAYFGEDSMSKSQNQRHEEFREFRRGFDAKWQALKARVEQLEKRK